MTVNPCFRLLAGMVALKPVSNLPVFQGALWSALLRHLLRRYLPLDTDLAETGICPVCRQNPPALVPGQPLTLELLVPAAWLHPVLEMLWDFNQRQTHGQFQPGQTLRLNTLHCGISQQLLAGFEGDAPQLYSEHLTPLPPGDLDDQIDLLLRSGPFTVVFDTPLRLRRPLGAKTAGHRFCDAEYFLEQAPHNAVIHLAASVRKLPPTPQLASDDVLAPIESGELNWTDVPYQRSFPKTLGGVTGQIRVAGLAHITMARRLVWGQFTGAGKNAAFGLGFYHIPEIWPGV